MLRRHHGHHRGVRTQIPASRAATAGALIRDTGAVTRNGPSTRSSRADPRLEAVPLAPTLPKSRRSEEHTSELQSLMRISYAVSCLQHKKHKHNNYIHTTHNT